ncbi:unnamed protein product [Heterobilharzia americana]|nr:unnamed protein product [Heterobilharzia americana]
MAFDPSLIGLKGFELLFPSLWNSVFLSSSEQKSISALVFTILSQILEFNSFVDFSCKLPSVLVISVEKACESYMLDTDCLLFLHTLLQYGIKHNIDLNDSMLKSLIICCKNFDSSCKDDSLWNRLLLMMKLMNSLTSPILFCLDCLKTKRFFSVNKQFCIVLQFLASLSTLCQSLEWLEEFCSKSNCGESFALIITTVTIELRLYLTEKSPYNKNKSIDIQQSPLDYSIEDESKNNQPSENCTDLMIHSDPTTINCSMLEACLVLFNHSVKELQKVDNTTNDKVDSSAKCDGQKSTGSLISFAADDTVKNIWLQCVDTGEAIKDLLVSYSSNTNKDSDCRVFTDTHLLWDNFTNQVKPFGAVLLETYFNWVSVYFTTHCMQFEEDSEIMSTFKELFNNYLSSVLPILSSLMTYYFLNHHILSDPAQTYFFDNMKLIQSVKNITSFLVQLARIPPNPKLFIDWFLWDSVDKPFQGEIVCKWLKEIWCTYFTNTQLLLANPLTELLTSILELINNCLLNTQMIISKNTFEQNNLLAWLTDRGELFQVILPNWMLTIDDLIVNQPSLCIEYICTVIKLWIIYQKWSKKFSSSLCGLTKESLLNIPDELLNRIDKVLSLSDTASSDCLVAYHLSNLSQAFIEAEEYDNRFSEISSLMKDF